MGRRRFELEITRDALAHVKFLPRKDHGLVLRALRISLSTEPFKETRNRKPLTLPAPFGAHWELRFGPANRYRAFYTLDGETILVLAIGVKERERLLIGGREVFP